MGSIVSSTKAVARSEAAFVSSAVAPGSSSLPGGATMSLSVIPTLVCPTVRHAAFCSLRSA
jgi:hypothetical protein